MVCVHVGAERGAGRGTCPGCFAGQIESGDSDSGAHGHTETGADISGL